MDVSIVCDNCHQGLNTGERQCSICSSIPQSVSSSNGPAHTGDSCVVDTALQSAYRDPGSPEAIFVHREGNGLRRCRAVENIRAHMSICETYKDLVIDKVSSVSPLELHSDPITVDSDVPRSVFDRSNSKRKRDQDMMLADDCWHGDSVVTEADQVMTQNVSDGEPMERRDPGSSDLSSEAMTTNVDYNGHDESDEEMLMEKPRTVRWFRFSVIDTGIGLAFYSLSLSLFLTLSYFRS